MCKKYYDKLGFKDLTEVQRKILNKKKNVLILSSCGSGKTEASYFNMLDDGKLIFIQPMKTLATSIRERLNNYNERLGLESVGIQHSGESEDLFLQSKYSVTTIDQVLSGYLALGRQSFMRGKNVLCSNLIFDEVQLFDTDSMLLTTINMLDDINKLNSRFIIMTATMPKYLIEFLKTRYDMEVIVTTEERKDRAVKLRHIEELDYEKISEYKGKQIIICNTINKLIEVHNKINSSRVMVLHSRFTCKDRELKEQEVVEYFGKNSNSNDKILITTQIVEAGMDISADVVYSEICPIDNLIQRDGRCCRWGGQGEVISFGNNSAIYDNVVVEKTKSIICSNQGITFNWDIQKQWLDCILNEYYEDKLSKKKLKNNKFNFRYCKRDKLIREVQNVNIIVSDTATKEDFNRNTVGVGISFLKKIKDENKLYILKKQKVLECKFSDIEIGDTILIQGHGTLYDRLGFRLEDNEKSNPFEYRAGIKRFEFTDYIKEDWIDHAELVKDLFSYNLRKDKFNDYIIKNLKKIAFYGGLHDLGKLDKEWQKKCGSPSTPLAHFPFTPCTKGEFRKHDYISAYSLKEIIDDDIIFNMILQHHRRFSIDEEIIHKVDRWQFHDRYKDILNEYGLDVHIKNSGGNIIIKESHIITPKHKEWTTLLYLVGLFMEVEIRAIKENIK